MGISLPDLQSMSISLPASFDALSGSPAIWWIAAGIVAVSAFYSIILGYHWLRYSVTSPVMLISMVVYLGGGAILIGIMVTAASAVTPPPPPFDLLIFFAQ